MLSQHYYKHHKLVLVIQVVLLDGVPIMHLQECVFHVVQINYQFKHPLHVNVHNYIQKKIVKIQDFVLTILQLTFVHHHLVFNMITRLLVLH